MSAVKWFEQARRLHAICPHCGVVFRLSEAAVYEDRVPPKTAFDGIREAIDRHARRVEKFEIERDELLEEEQERGEQQAHEELKKISPDFGGRGIDPEDVRVIFDPLRYIVFRGLDSRNVTAIEFVDEEPTSTERERFIRSVENALKNGNVAWATWRVTDAGRVEVERVLH